MSGEDMKMRSSVTALLLAAALAGSGLVAVAGTAQAATKTFYATESVNIRQKATKNSKALGLLPKGKAAQAVTKDGSIKFYEGGTHNACGSKNTIHYDIWSKVTYKGITGYVPQPCLLPFKP